jgi:hypothetical protein
LLSLFGLLIHSYFNFSFWIVIADLIGNPG